MDKITASPQISSRRNFLLRMQAVWITFLFSLVSVPGTAQVTQQGNKLSANDSIGNSQLGMAVAVAGDGNTVITGGPLDNFDYGASWIFSRSAGMWNQQGKKLVGTGVTSTNAPFQGWSVAISSDGNTSTVGGIEDRAEYGAAWAFARSSAGWIQQGAKLADPPDQPGGQPGQGYSVALSSDGNTALVGAAGTTDLCCSAAVFVYTRAAGVWSKQTLLAGSSGEVVGPFVSLSGDGNTALVSGSTLGGVGVAYVYMRSGTTWSRQAALAPGDGAINSVSLSSDGNTALLGAPQDNGGVGAAWVFTRSGAGWNTQGIKLVGAGAVGLPAQGASVAISGDGTTAVVGAPGDNAYSGAAWLFRSSGSTWSQIGDKLVGTGAVGNARQGQSVAISADSGTVVVGGPSDNFGVGAVWIYTLPLQTPPPPTTTFAPIRINAGGPSFVDASGTTWAADSGFNGGNAFAVSAPISGTINPALYQSERWSGTTLQYQFPVPSGTYTVNLKFAEIYFNAAGLRVFNIVINGQTVETNFDPFVAAGASLRAVDKSYTINATSGAITIQLVPVISNPKISGIEIVTGTSGTVTPPPPPPPTTTFTPIRINAGGGSFVDASGTTWAADSGYNGGYAFAVSAPISGTTNPALYQSERWAGTTLQYQFPVPSGTYTVNLKFAEIYFNAAGLRVFNIVINGQTVETNFDPFVAAGAWLRAVDKSYTINATNGAITIELVPVISNPKISGIEIVTGTGGTVTPPPPPTTTFTPIRVNAGAAAPYTDPAGQVWAADTGFEAGFSFATGDAIANTTTPVLYQTERWSGSTLRYRFAVPNGSYAVRLKFAEIYFASGAQRVFNIVINGQTSEMNFDPYQAAGGRDTAVDRTYTVNVTTGEILIELVPVVSNPKISAIEITAAASSFSINFSPSYVALFLSVDGVGYDADAGNVYTFPCVPGSVHTATVVTTGLTFPFSFGGWNDGVLTPSRQITCASSPVTYTAIINVQYLLALAP